MAHNLSFSVSHSYSSSEIGISVPVRLSTSQNVVDFTAYIDTGATFCIFQRIYGELLGLDIEAGTQEWIGQVNDRFLTYGHEVSLYTIGYQFDTMVYFARDEFMDRNVLGRQGWLNLVRVGIVHYERNLYLSDFNEEISIVH